MKNVIKVAAVVLGSTVAGLLVWRKVEAARLENDLWAEAEKAAAEQDAAQLTSEN